MKKVLGVVILLMLILFALCSCQSSASKQDAQDTKVNYTGYSFGNVITDGEIAVFFDFDSDYMVNKMEIAGSLLDRNGNSIHAFDTAMSLDPATNHPSPAIMVDVGIIKDISSVSFTKIKAYTSGFVSSGAGTPTVVVPAVKNPVDEIIIMFVFVLIIGGVVAIMVWACKQEKENYDSTNSNSSDGEVEIDVETSVDSEKDKISVQYDKFEEIKKYKELLDLGIITQEEFEEKKKELLG